MPDLDSNSQEPGAPIRITRLNTDKTRSVGGEGYVYEIYFELSRAPSGAWRDGFLLVSGDYINACPDEVQFMGIDGRFLIVRCRLESVQDSLLILLRGAVSDANRKFDKHLQKAALEQMQKEEAWKREREAVEAAARRLHSY
jgi:hypothetical protein